MTAGEEEDAELWAEGCKILALTDAADAEAASARAARHPSSFQALAGGETGAVVAGHGAALEVLEPHHGEQRQDWRKNGKLHLSGLDFIFSAERIVI